MKGIIKRIIVEHVPTYNPYEGCEPEPAMLVIRARLATRHLVTLVVQTGLDSLNVGLKVLMAEEFFAPLAGRQISLQPNTSSGEKYVVVRNSIPDKFQVSYLEMKKQMGGWLAQNRVQLIDRVNEQLRLKAEAASRASKVADDRRRVDAAEHLGLMTTATWLEINREFERIKKENDNAARQRCAEEIGLPKDSSWDQIWQERHRREKEAARLQDIERYRQRAIRLGLSPNATREEIHVAEGQRVERETRQYWQRRVVQARTLAFRQEPNPKYGNTQWVARQDGKIYRLDYEDSYEAFEQKILVEVTRELVPNRVYLVERIHVPKEYRTLVSDEAVIT